MHYEIKTNPMLESLGHPIEILLIEDNPSDIRLTQEALKESNLQNNLHVAEDGEEALDFLYQRDPYAQEPQPDLILLDLNLPNLDGREVLSQIKQDEHPNHIPVVVLTTSDAGEDIMKSYQLYANGSMGGENESAKTLPHTHTTTRPYNTGRHSMGNRSRFPDSPMRRRSPSPRRHFFPPGGRSCRFIPNKHPTPCAPPAGIAQTPTIGGLPGPPARVE